MGYKYAVVKIHDIDNLLDNNEREQMYILLNAINFRRAAKGKSFNKYLVVNQDEPYAPAVLNLMKLHGHWEDSQLEYHHANSIEILCKQVHENAIDKGWYDDPKTFGELIALVHSELSEALEEYRSGRAINETYYVNGTKPCGIATELADVVIRVFDMCGYYGIDLEEAIAEKMAYNKSRSHKHGGKRL